MQYRSPNSILASCGVYCHSTDTIGGLTSTICDVGHSIGSLSLVT